LPSLDNIKARSAINPAAAGFGLNNAYVFRKRQQQQAGNAEMTANFDDERKKIKEEKMSLIAA
jgi:hypothetical protein